MQADEVDRLYRKIRALWPDWSPTDEQAELWQDCLGKYDDPIMLRKAIEAHAAESTWRRPTLKAIGVQVALLSANAFSGGQTTGDGPACSGMFIQCVEGKGAGWFFELVFAHTVPEDWRLRKIAEGWIEDHQRIYGGRWQMMDCRELEADKRGLVMCRSRAKLMRPKAPLLGYQGVPRVKPTTHAEAG